MNESNGFLYLPKSQQKQINPLAFYFQALVNEMPDCDFDRRIIEYRKWAIYSFIQSEDKLFPFRKPRGTKNILNAEVKLWRSVLAIAERMFTYQYWEIDPAFTLFNIILENQLVLLPCGLSDQNNNSHNIKGFVCLYQGQNKKLLNSDFLNAPPFDKEKHPLTWRFISVAMKVAENHLAFRKEFYLPMVRSRQNLTAILNKEKVAVFTTSGILKKGRKPS